MHCVMSQITIKLSDKADALIAQLQKEIFNRRRKKVTAAGVVETLVESGASFHADLHTGNVLYLPASKSVGFIDFGVCGTLPPWLRGKLLLQLLPSYSTLS